MEIQPAKQRFGIIGNHPGLNRALETAMRVAPTDLSVLITGESGVGKEAIPQLIHSYSSRKHNKYIAVNCGAIPEGTMDSELFGHVKGSFTGATAERKGYFEEADKGTIFLDEVAEMPLETQVKLLRVLESGEFIKVGASSIQKTDVRIVAATNVEVLKAIEKGKFREDLYYRLNTVPISLPPLRKRQDDIHLLFRKFAYDFAERYRMPVIRLASDAVGTLESYHWPGNIRQLKNITEQLSILETNREIDTATLLKYLPDYSDNQLPALVRKEGDGMGDSVMYHTVIEMRKELDTLKKAVYELWQTGQLSGQSSPATAAEPDAESAAYPPMQLPTHTSENVPVHTSATEESYYEHEEVEEVLSLAEKEKELIEKALEKHRGKRRPAAEELGISERTLYRKIKEYNL